jgi:hypothetical protein
MNLIETISASPVNPLFLSETLALRILFKAAQI